MVKQIEQLKKVAVPLTDLLDLIHWARRYCDRRRSYAAGAFNDIYKHLLKKYPEIAKYDKVDTILEENGKHFPFATNGEMSMFPIHDVRND